ncbi:MAG: LysR family transcriptional regulator [Alphaproteobacteria bacterium]|nr:MAG: LysR family transcriptional regulator [Alphaproteobacteria bacterium]
MDFKQLQYFVCVVDAHSFSRAAGMLKLAQPTLSRQIALLEKDLGYRLLTRTGRGVVPSEAGAALLVHARRMLESARMAREELSELQESPRGRVAVGLPPRIALGLSADLVALFRKSMPRVVISIFEGQSPQLREWLLEGKLDLALLFDPAPSTQLDYEQLLRETLLLVAPMQGSALPERVSLPFLSRYPMVLPAAPNAIRSLIDALLRPQQIELNVIAEVGAVQTVLSLVAQGIGCTILPAGALNLGAKQLMLRTSLIGPPTVYTNIVLASHRSGHVSRAVQETMRMLRAVDYAALRLPGVFDAADPMPGVE